MSGYGAFTWEGALLTLVLWLSALGIRAAVRPVLAAYRRRRFARGMAKALALLDALEQEARQKRLRALVTGYRVAMGAVGLAEEIRPGDLAAEPRRGRRAA